MNQPLSTTMRAGRPVRAFTPQEDEMIEWLRVHGWTPFDIALFIGRAKSSVRNRLVALARHMEGGDDDDDEGYGLDIGPQPPHAAKDVSHKSPNHASNP